MGSDHFTFGWAQPLRTTASPVLYYAVLKDGVRVATTTGRVFRLSGLEPDFMLSVTVQACNTSGCSPDSEALIVTTNPAPASALKLTAGNARITASWSEAAISSSGEISLWYRESSVSAWSEWTPGVPDASGAVIDGLINGVTYVVKVRATSGAGYSDSPSSSATPMDVPEQPTLTFSNVSHTGIILAWTWPATTSRVPRYFEVFKDGTKVVTTTGRYQALSKLSPLQEYDFAVRSCNVAGCSALSETLTILLPPPPATGLVAVPGVDTLTLSWRNSPTASYHSVSYRLANAAVWTTYVSETSISSPVTLSGLEGGALYELRVGAHNISGLGTYATLEATPLGPPRTPSIISQSAATPTSAALKWVAPVSIGSRITSYRVIVDGSLHTSLGGTTTSAVISGLQKSSSYSVSIIACNTIGCSQPSPPLVVFTSPPEAVGLAASPTGTASSISWSVAASPTVRASVLGHRIFYRQSGQSQWKQHSSSAYAASGETLTNLTVLTSYEVFVRTYNRFGYTDSNVLQFTTLFFAIPSSPPTVVASAGTASATLSWSAPVESGQPVITNYVVEYSTDGGDAWVTAVKPISRALTLKVTGLAVGVAHTFRVSAVNVAGTSAPRTAPSSVTPYSIPGAPSGLEVTTGARQVVLSWSAPVNTGWTPLTSYEVQYSADGKAWTPFKYAPSLARTVAVTGLTNGIFYYFKVAAVNIAGTGAFTTLTTPAAPMALAAPPSRVTAAPGNGLVSVGWPRPVSDGGSVITDYQVQYSSTNGSSWVTFPRPLSSALSTTVTGLNNGTSYVFRVSAINSLGASPFSPVSAPTTPRTTPDAATAPVATPGSARATISWQAPLSDGGGAIKDYLVQYSLNGSTWMKASDPVSASTTATVVGLIDGKSYIFRVIALNAIGSGPPSPASNAVTPRSVPGAPRSLGGAPGDGSASLGWAEPSDGGASITDYLVELSSDGGTSWTPFDDGLSTTPAAKVTGLTNGLSYKFRVAAVNAAGTGPFSTPAGVVVDPVAAAPYNITGVSRSGSVLVSWTAPVQAGATVVDYSVIFSSDGGSTWTPYSDSISTSQFSLVEGLTNLESYSFKIAAVTPYGVGPYSTPGGPFIPHAEAGAPVGLAAAPGNKSADLSWSAPVDASGFPATSYVVSRTIGTGSSWTVLATISAPTVSYLATGLTNGISYTFKVQADNGSGGGSSYVTVTPGVFPGTPTALAGTAGNAQVSLSWTAPTSTGGAPIYDYVVQYSTDGTSWISFADGTSSTTSATVTGLVNGTPYTFRVAATTSTGTGAFSVASGAVTPFTTPGAPTSLSDTPGNSQVVLNWFAPDSDGGAPLTNYVIEFSTDSGVTWAPFQDGVSTATTATITGLMNGTQYAFRVAAVNAAGQGPWTLATGSTPDGLPESPTAVSGTAGPNSVPLLWAAPPANGSSAITDYVVEYALTADMTWRTFADGVSTSTSATVTGLEDSTEYVFRVAAVNTAGRGPRSITSEAVTTFAPLTLSYGPLAIPATSSQQAFYPTVNGAYATTRFSVSGALPDGVLFDDDTGVFSTSGLTGTSSGATDLDWYRDQAGNLASGGSTNAGLNNTANAVVVQPDGKILVGGLFVTVNSTPQNRVARLNIDGSLDTSFGNGMGGANGTVTALARQSDGKVLVGGSFSAMNTVSRGNIARLNSDGSLDTAFGNGLAGANNTVNAIAVQPDGKVLVAGAFTTVNGTSRGRVARLNSDGSLDTGFGNGLAGVNGTASALTVQPDGKVLVAGAFTTVNGTSRGRIARLNSDGSLDTAFGNGLTGVNGTASAIALQADGRVLVGGAFTTVNGSSRTRIARLNTDGTLDTTFGNGLAGASSPVLSIAVQPDGKIVIGGSFVSVNGAARARVARLNSLGALDSSFGSGSAGADNSVNALALESDGTVLVGGAFSSIDSLARRFLARLNSSGIVSPGFGNGTSGANGIIYAVTGQADGKILTAGSFSTMNGVIQGNVARLNADGTLDTGFGNGLSGTDGIVYGAAVQPDGKIVIVGAFTTVNGTSKTRIARLNEDGTLDTGFANGLAGADNVVNAVTVQADGRIVVAGAFASVHGTPRSSVARLNSDGSLDTTFGDSLLEADSPVNAVAVQADGKILIGGIFSTVNGSSRGNIARLNSDGSLDTTFGNGLAGASGTVTALAVQPDGKVLLAGTFSTVNGSSRGNIARLNSNGSLDTTFGNGLAGASSTVTTLAVQPDGKVVLGGLFTTVNGTARGRIARLNSNGSLDTTFGNGLAGSNNGVYAVVVQSDGKILLGGATTLLNGAPVNRIARLATTLPAASTVTVTVTAYGRSFSLPVELTQVAAGARPNPPTALSATVAGDSVSLSWAAPADNGIAITDYLVEFSSDLVNWTLYSDGVSTSTGAVLSGLTANTDHYFRVRAVASGAVSAPAGTPNVTRAAAAMPEETETAPEVSITGFKSAVVETQSLLEDLTSIAPSCTSPTPSASGTEAPEPIICLKPD